ncbi:MAG: alpha/beta fold hydrolase [Chloroflexaceae bacterium]|nr:alpha/beta fold hydrolase [Chloroflexaceae bacterium]
MIASLRLLARLVLVLPLLLHPTSGLAQNDELTQTSGPNTIYLPLVQAPPPPLIFVPGGTGSRLVNNKGEQWPSMQRLFDSNDDAFLNVLRLAPDGNAPFAPSDPDYTSVRVGDILRLDTVSFLGATNTIDTYQTTITTLTQAGYVEGRNLFVFAYDWRKDITGQANLLLREIDRVRVRTGASKVNILAHSMGGMLTRTVLSNSNSHGKINRVITLGTPVLGATKALGMLQYQAPCFVEKPWFTGGGCATNEATFQNVLTNMPGAYQLLPSPLFDQAVGSALYIDRDTNGDGKVEGFQSYDYWAGIVRSSRNANLVTQAKDYHAANDVLRPVDPAVEIIRVVGTGLNTPQYIRERCGNILCSDVIYNVEWDAKGGDGTVPLHSADLHNPLTGVDLRGSGRNFYASGVEHGALARDATVLQLAIAFFAGRQVIIVDPPNQQTGPDVFVSATPTALAGLELKVSGAAATLITDQQGRHFGAPRLLEKEFIENDIPGANYLRFGDSQSFFFNQPGVFTTRVKVLGKEPVQLQLDRYADGSHRERALLFAQPLPVGAKISVSFSNDTTFAELRVQLDRDGDGVPDETVTPASITGELKMNDN